MTQPPVIRLYQEGDSPACLELFDSNVPEFFANSERSEFESFLADLPGPYLLMFDPPRELVACGGYALTPDGKTADLCWGMVRHDRHRRGIGRDLTLRRLELATQDPVVQVVALNTSQHTAGFYERLGFRVLTVTKDGYGVGMDRCDMVLELDRSEPEESG